MYVINTILRIIRFVSNSFIGLVVGFILGWFAAHLGISGTMDYIKSL
jgi:hypothetical protein